MPSDMSLISLKDGGRFAMSWLAGTNPKALRSNSHSHSIYSVDVIDVCEEIIKSVKTKDNRLSFRVLTTLCFGTTRIHAEQVKHLYDVTLNFVSFHTLFLKEYSRNKLSSTLNGSDNPMQGKRIHLESSDDLDISSLLIESETFNKYTEEKFQFPNEVGHAKKISKNISTCIEIKQITIRHVSWDARMPETEDAFGDASQDEVSFLLSGLKDSFQRPRCQKRQTAYSAVDCSPFKKPCRVNESVDDVRYNQSSNYDSMSEAEFEPTRQTTQQSIKNTNGFNANELSHVEFESTRLDTLSRDQESIGQLSHSHIPLDQDAFEDSNPLSPLLQEYVTQKDDDIAVDCASRIDSPTSTATFYKYNTNTVIPSGRKRKRSRARFDTTTQIPIHDDDDLENIMKYCFDIDKGEHIISAKKPRIPISLNQRITSSRFQSTKLLSRFKKNLKPRLKQEDHDCNRRLIVRGILDDGYEEFKTLFGIRETFSESRDRRKRFIQRNRTTMENNNHLLDDNNNINIVMNETNNNNIQIQSEPSSYFQFEVNEAETQKEQLTLNCSIDEINPFAVSFDFPVEAGQQRSEWGKEGIMTKLLFAWTSEDSAVNMKSILSGANRINAALAFHTLLDLAGQKYIEIVKGDTNTIESIEIGPESIKKINASMSA